METGFWKEKDREKEKDRKIQMETGEWKEKMKVQISEKKYAKEEIGEQISKAAEELPAQILGENKVWMRSGQT